MLTFDPLDVPEGRRCVDQRRDSVKIWHNLDFLVLPVTICEILQTCTRVSHWSVKWMKLMLGPAVQTWFLQGQTNKGTELLYKSDTNTATFTDSLYTSKKVSISQLTTDHSPWSGSGPILTVVYTVLMWLEGEAVPVISHAPGSMWCFFCIRTFDVTFVYSFLLAVHHIVVKSEFFRRLYVNVQKHWH